MVLNKYRKLRSFYLKSITSNITEVAPHTWHRLQVDSVETFTADILSERFLIQELPMSHLRNKLGKR